MNSWTQLRDMMRKGKDYISMLIYKGRSEENIR